MNMQKIIVPALPRVLPHAARKKVEAAAQAHADALAALVAFLDTADGDPDLEPSLGASGGTYDAEWSAPDYRDSTVLACVDLEGEHDGREPDADNEPSLGALLNHERQTGWANSATEDLEDALAHG